ncbi:MAG: helicase C-terminal domain-containing protein, partial [Candidatus Nanopelagicales bacterium]
LQEMAAQVGLGAQAGLDEREWTGLDVGSPFDYRAQGILYVARHLPPPGRDGIPEEALDEIGDLVDAAGGRSLILCSSWRAVERLGEYLRVRVSTPVIVQKKGETAAPLVGKFSSDESASLVVIDRIPFPRPDDPLVSARQDAVDSAGGSGFRSVSVPKAALLLAQGTGRLIRSPEDRGVVAVLDPRLATAGYARALRESLPPLWFTTDKSTVIGSLERLASSY